jgi:hypothetical protein
VLRDRLPSEKKLLRLELPLLFGVPELTLVALEASLTPLGVELVLCTEDELVVEGDGARRRDIAAGR